MIFQISSATYSTIDQIPTDSTELGALGEQLKGTASKLGSIIHIIDQELTTMAKGDLTYNAHIKDMPGELSEVKVAINYIQKQLSKTLEEVAHTSSTLADGAESLAASATEMAMTNRAQSDAVDLFKETTSEVIASVNSVSDQIQDATSLTLKGSNSVERGTAIVSELVDNISQVSKFSNEISNILLTIEKIAQQTNLLALNASIEAARAGESGKGFSVVASEIRTLANDTSVTVKQIEEILHATSESVKRGEQSAEDTKNVLSEISVSVSATNDLSHTLHKMSTDQRATLDKLETVTTTISNLIGDNATSAETNANISEELSSQSDGLRELISQFKY